MFICLSGLSEEVIKLLQDMWLMKMQDRKSAEAETAESDCEEDAIVIAQSEESKLKSLGAIPKSKKLTPKKLKVGQFFLSAANGQQT